MPEYEPNTSWLLEEDNPGVRVRALTGLCGYPQDHQEVMASRCLVMQTLPAARDLSWMEVKGQSLTYNLTALAESGLTCADVAVEAVADKVLSPPFDANCGELMALRALVILGYGHDPRIGERLARLQEVQLPDGGWLCLHRVNKMKRVPKSCIRAAMHGLLFFAELRRQGLHASGEEQLIDYFLRRRVFYRTDDPTQLVLNDHPGRRMTDVFFPIEYFRVGLPVLLDAFAVLGVGEAPELREAWRLLDEKIDPQGRVLLEGTLPLKTCYLPKERVGKPSKWATLYACLAWKDKEDGGTGMRLLG
jgi:hypothetical protein